MNTDLEATVTAIANLGASGKFAPPPTLEFAGRFFVWREDEHAYDEYERHVEDNSAYLARVDVATVDSLCRWIEQLGTEDAEIRLSRTGATEALSPRRTDRWSQTEQATKAFFACYLPQRMPYSLLGFRSWVDGLGDGLVNREGIELALNSVTMSSGTSVKVETQGAVVSITSEDASGTKTAKKLPRLMTAEIPFGDPGFKARVTFRVTATSGRDGLQFSVVLHCPEPAHDAYVTWAESVIAERIGDKVPVFVTP